MNINTGKIYDSYEEAIRNGEDDRDLVSAIYRETLEELKRRLNLNNKYKPHQGIKERNRRLRRTNGNSSS